MRLLCMIAENQVTAAALAVPEEPRKRVVRWGAVAGWFDPLAGYNSTFTWCRREYRRVHMKSG